MLALKKRPHLYLERYGYSVIVLMVSVFALMSQCIICKAACSCKHRQSSEAWSCRISCQTD